MSRYYMSNIESEVTFIWAGQFISFKNWKHKKRISNFHELIFVNEGCLHIQVGDQQIEAKKNSIVFIPSGVLHYGTKENTEKTSFYWFHFTLSQNSVFTTIYKNKIKKSIKNTENIVLLPTYFNKTSFSRLNILCTQLLDTQFKYNKNRYYLDLIMTSLLLEVTEETLHDVELTHSSNKKNLAFLLAWIDANLDQELTLTTISTIFNYNPSYLSRLFSEKMNISLNKYIKHLRIEKAKALLAETNLSVSEISSLCGFQDVKYFMNCFKKMESLTATEYRDAFTKKLINTK